MPDTITKNLIRVFNPDNPTEGVHSISPDALESWKSRGFVEQSKTKTQADLDKEPTFSRYAKPTEEDYFGSLRTGPVTQGEEKTIRQSAADAFQSSIDAINKQYTSLVTGEEQLGERRLGRARSVASAGGTLGSSFGTAKMGRVEDYTQQQIKLLREEEAVKIAGIMGKIDTRALEEIRLKKEEVKGNVEAYLNYIADNREDARSDATQLAESGIALSRMKEMQGDQGESYYDQLIEETGWDKLEFDLLYESKLPEEAQLTYSEMQYEKDGNIWMKRYAFDPVTQKKTEYDYDMGLPYESGGIEYTTKVLDDGTVLLFPKKFDPDKSIQEQIIQYGETGEFAKDTDIVSDEYLAGRQFILDNPNSPYNELFQGLKDNTDLPNDEIKKLLDEKEEIIEEKKELSKTQLIEVARNMKQADIENYFNARYSDKEIKEIARSQGFEGGGFLGIGITTSKYLKSPEAREKMAELLEEQYIASGYTITE